MGSEISLSWHVAFQTEMCYSTMETHRFIRIFKIILKIIQIGGPQFVFQQLGIKIQDKLCGLE